MASGGYQPNKPGKSEHRRQSNWQQSVSSDRDDAQSLNSLPSDMRINNWDLSDLRPSNLGGDSKRRKKSKGNPEREREQSLSVDLPPRDKKHHAPSSYPQRKNIPSAAKPHRSAVENLKHRTTFSDLEDQVSTDGERNNERQASQSRRRLRNASMNKTDSEDDAAGKRGGRHINRNNNMDYSTREQGPDSNEIVAHLMQIRDFTKQARSMLESMEKLGDRKKSEDIEKLRRLIRNLQEQEQGYRGLLQNTLAHRDGGKDEAAGGEEDAVTKTEGKYDSDDNTSVDLEVWTEESETTNSQDSRPRIESKLGIGSDVDDEGAEDQYGMPVQWAAGNSSGNASSTRAVDLENTLTQGQTSLSGLPVQESEEGARGATAIDGDALTPQHQELLQILREKQEQLRAIMIRQEELNVKRRETEKKLLEAQTRDNKARAALAAVAFGQQFAEQRLATLQAASADAEHGGASWEANGDGVDGGAVGEEKQLKSNIVGYPESDDEDNSKVREVDSLPTELLELRRQLSYLRNEFSQVAEAPKNVESETRSSLTEGREQLQNKIQELQNKKSQMDRLLQELQMLHSQPLDNLRNNETTPQDSSILASTSVSSNIPTTRQQTQQKLPARAAPSGTSPNSGLSVNHQTRTNEMMAAPSAVDKAIATFANLSREGVGEEGAEGMEPEMVQEVQEKLKCLKEVRGQLEQLRSLVQYYQGQKDEMEAGANWTNQPPVPGFSESAFHRQDDAETRSSRSSLQQMHQSQRQQQELLQLHTQQPQQQRQQRREAGTNASSSAHNMVQMPNVAGADQGGELSDEDNASVSQSESQWSHLGPWDDDPEIQEKVRKLKAAKEKLRQLQDLVAFVQQSPDAARSLPENQGDLAASVEGETVSHATQTDEPNVSVSEGEVTSETMRIPPKDGSHGRESPRAELERLRKERAMLLEIQNQLKNMQNQVNKTSTDERGDTQRRPEPRPDLGKTELENNPSATVVTFASNDELYSKMRRQRILREELRSKKKELEAIMKKDRNKRQYSRNQDNQSDTVSLNTDTFGIPASVDATMATWGGSTVDNLENITEDEDRQERSDHARRDEDDEDDGYPSDMVRVEEEEEDENDSNDGTYTIEQGSRQRESLRKGANSDLGARPKTSRGRQAYLHSSNREKNKNKPLRKQSSSRNSDGQRHARSRQEDFGSALEQRPEDRVFKGQDYEWFRAIGEKLSGLSNSVDTLLKKSEAEDRQLSVSLSQDTVPQATSLMSPMQEQMLQLQNQSIMLSFGQLVQTITHQQGDIQHLQQQVQALQLQVQDIHSNHSFHVAASAGAGPHHLLSQPLSNTARNGYSLQTTAAVGTHAFAISHQQMPSPFAQSNLNSTAPTGLFHELSAHSPGLHNFQPGGVGLSTSNLSLGLDTRATGGPGGLGASLTVNTGSNLSLPRQGKRPGFSPMGQSTSNSQHHLTSHVGSSVSQGNTHTSNLSGSSNQQYQLNPAGRFSFLPSQMGENQEMENEGSLPRLDTHLLERTKHRKYGPEGNKSESDPASGMKMSTPKIGSFQSRDDGGNISAPRWEPEPYTDYRSVSAGGGFSGAVSSSQSSIQSIKDQHSKLRKEQIQMKSSTTAEENTLFDALCDTIYAEVASVISQNENRPHFLLELFRDMRQIDSDFMRQRALFSMQELVRPDVKDSIAASPSSHSWSKATANTADTGKSEQTPSESITSEDDEDLKISRLQDQIQAAERSQLDRWSRNGALRSFPFDYAEIAENPSSLSTPTNAEVETSFYKKSEQAGLRVSEQLPKDLRNAKTRGKRKLQKAAGAEAGLRSQGSRSNEMSSIPPAGQAGGSTFSDLPYAHIDMKKLDQQIKDIMMETIPLVKRHMDDVCSAQLLGYIKRLVLSLTCQTDSHRSVVRFFQLQLSSVLENTLQKYEGKRMRDCGEDLLVEISDVLFNELAYFRLMEDLGDSNVTDKKGRAEWISKAENSSAYTASSSSSGEFDEEKNRNGAGQEHEQIGERQGNSYTYTGLRVTQSNQDRLGRDRDVDLVSETGAQDSEEKEKDETGQKYKIELAPSETKPFTRIGSDEDDDEGDEERSVDDPSETAVSRDSMLEVSGHPVPGPPLSTRPETEGGQEDGQEKQDQEKMTSPKRTGQAAAVKPQDGGDGAEVSSANNTSASAVDNVQINGTVNGENSNISDEELTVADLPERLNVLPAASNSALNSPPELKSK